MKTIKLSTCALFCLTMLAMLEGCKSAVTVNSDLHRRSIDHISLSPYRSPQERTGVPQDPHLALGVSISGGGSRAQYYGIGVLMGLEEIVPRGVVTDRNFLHDVDYFSTVSGGGFAAAYYLTVRKSVLPQTKQTFRNFCLSPYYQSLCPKIHYNAVPLRILDLGDYEDNNPEKMSFPDRIGKELLQQGKRYSPQSPRLDVLRMSDFFTKADASPPTLPMFVPNGTIYNNAELIPFMPHILDSLQIMGSLTPEEKWASANPSKNATMASDGFRMPVRYAVAASSAFPGLIPLVNFSVKSRRPIADTAGEKPIIKKRQQESTVEQLRIADGGIVDNLGYLTLLRLLREDSVKKKSALIVDCSGTGVDDIYGPKVLRVPELVRKALFFTLASKYAEFDEDIEARKKLERIDSARHLKIGITDLRDRTRKIKKVILYQDSLDQKLVAGSQKDDFVKKFALTLDMDTLYLDLNALRSADSIVQTLRLHAGERMSKAKHNRRWNEFYNLFLAMMNGHVAKKEVDLDPLSSEIKSEACIGLLDQITSSSFSNFNEADQLLLYELASLIETNVKIRNCAEKSILVLAGRYTVFLREEAILAIYNNQNPAP